MTNPHPLLQELNDTLALSHVPRWSIVTLSRPQSVAEHSFRVAAIVKYLLNDNRYTSWDIEDIDAAIKWALIHDAAESKSGDISGPFKRLLGPAAVAIAEDAGTPWLGVPSSQDIRSVVKLADDIETYTLIKMYGQGAHAAYVADRCYVRMMESAKAAGWDASDVDRIASYIINEIGRT